MFPSQQQTRCGSKYMPAASAEPISTSSKAISNRSAHRLFRVTRSSVPSNRSARSVTDQQIGARVGVAWLHRTCGCCSFCTSQRENLCDSPEFTGWTVHGGFAEYLVAPASFTYPLPDGFSDLQAAPLLCAGIIGYRCLSKTGIDDWSGARLGLYGFGAAGHVAIQIARARGAEVYVCTRDREQHQALAEELGAVWTGGTMDKPPVALDAGIIFAPAGEIVPAALSHLDKGGTLVLGGIHMSPIPRAPVRASLSRARRSQCSQQHPGGRTRVPPRGRSSPRADACRDISTRECQRSARTP